MPGSRVFPAGQFAAAHRGGVDAYALPMEAKREKLRIWKESGPLRCLQDVQRVLDQSDAVEDEHYEKNLKFLAQETESSLFIGAPAPIAAVAPAYYSATASSMHDTWEAERQAPGFRAWYGGPVSPSFAKETGSLVMVFPGVRSATKFPAMIHSSDQQHIAYLVGYLIQDVHVRSFMTDTSCLLEIPRFFDNMEDLLKYASYFKQNLPELESFYARSKRMASRSPSCPNPRKKVRPARAEKDIENDEDSPIFSKLSRQSLASNLPPCTSNQDPIFARSVTPEVIFFIFLQS